MLRFVTDPTRQTLMNEITSREVEPMHLNKYYDYSNGLKDPYLNYLAFGLISLC